QLLAGGADPLAEPLDHGRAHPTAHRGLLVARAFRAREPIADRGDGNYIAHPRRCALCCAVAAGASCRPLSPAPRRRFPMTAPAPAPATARPESRLLRWFGSYGTFAVPQAAAPIAFSLIALPLTGSASAGAAMMLAMTIAQVLGAVPLS